MLSDFIILGLKLSTENLILLPVLETDFFFEEVVWLEGGVVCRVRGVKSLGRTSSLGVTNLSKVVLS